MFNRGHGNYTSMMHTMFVFVYYTTGHNQLFTVDVFKIKITNVGIPEETSKIPQY